MSTHKFGHVETADYSAALAHLRLQNKMSFRVEVAEEGFYVKTRSGALICFYAHREETPWASFGRRVAS